MGADRRSTEFCDREEMVWRSRLRIGWANRCGIVVGFSTLIPPAHILDALLDGLGGVVCAL